MIIYALLAADGWHFMEGDEAGYGLLAVIVFVILAFINKDDDSSS